MNDLSSFGNWQLMRRLGSGSFGEVMLWKHRGSGQELATKRLIVNKDDLGVDEVAKIKMRWQQELSWMRDLQTDYIVRGVNLQDSAFMRYLNANHAWQPLEVITMQYCNSGDLRTHLQKVENINGLQEYEVREIMCSLLHAINFMHEKCKIEHRDLKPDNIVVHQNGKQRCYKLTDFGFARSSTEYTIQKSMVGTRHYFAPEIVHPAKYTKTVDYWSAGIIAFELMCGALPFIPHQDLYEIIRTVKAKESNIVAITEKINQPKQYLYHNEVFREHHLSDVFASQMSDWLRIALDINYKSRGTKKSADDGVAFFKDFDKIYDSKILRIFCPTTGMFYFYPVTPTTKLMELIVFLVKETGLAQEEICFVFPLGHPRQQIVPSAYSLYVEEWQDTTDKMNPVAMLFVISVTRQHDIAVPEVSEVIKSCLSLDRPEKVPEWVIEKFEQQTHFLLTNETKLYHTFISAYKNYALKIEQEIADFYVPLSDLQSRVEHLSGQSDHFMKMVQSAQSAFDRKVANGGHTTFFVPWLLKAEKLDSAVAKIRSEVVQALQQRLNSAKRHIKAEANSAFLEEAERRDVFELAEFRHQLQHKLNTKDRFERCRTAVYNCIGQREKVYASKVLSTAIFNIMAVHKEHRKMGELLRNTVAHIENLGERLQVETTEFFDEISNMRTGCINNVQPMFSSEVSSATFDLLKDTNETIRLLANFDFNDDMREIPTTLSDIKST